MWHRKHTYMRLDGSSKISERRDMVADFQARLVFSKTLPNLVMIYHGFECDLLIVSLLFFQNGYFCFSLEYKSWRTWHQFNCSRYCKFSCLKLNCGILMHYDYIGVGDEVNSKLDYLLIILKCLL